MTDFKGIVMARKQRRIALIWVVVAFVWGAVWLRTAVAQTQPASAPLGDPLHLGQADQPSTDQADGAGPAPSRSDVIGLDDLYRPDAPTSPYWGSSAEGYPAYEARTVPLARAQDVYARQTYQRAQNDVSDYYRGARQAFEDSPAYRDAADAERQAFEQLQRAEENALKPLESNDTYQAQMQLRDRLTHQIADAKFGPDTAEDPAKDPVLRAMAASKLSYAEAMRDVERTLLDEDQAVADARSALSDAGDKMRKLEESFDRRLRTDETLAMVKSHTEDLRIARLVTAAYLDSAIRARNNAFDYALLIRGIRQYGYTPINGYGGYGYGGYGGYGYGGYGLGYGGFGVGTVGGGGGGTIFPPAAAGLPRGAGFSSSVGVAPGSVGAVPGSPR